MAIDDQNTLHVTWCRYYYPSFWRQYYRNYNPISASASSTVDITANYGSTSARTAGLNIAVDQGNTVWLAAHGTGSWVERLLQSDNAYAAGGTFTDRGAISPSASAQTSRLTVDATGLIHCCYYRNTGSGVLEHRIYDPVAASWGTATILGDNAPTRDLYGQLAADSLGNVHAVYVQDADSSSTWKFRYKRWDPINNWSPEVVIMDVTPAQFSGIANYRIIALGVDESTGRAYIVYRDLGTTGALRFAEKGLTDSAFTLRPDLAPANLGQHAYYLPTIRGSIFPTFNNTGSEIDITWHLRRTPGTPPYSLMFQRESVAACGTTIALSAPAIIGTSTTVDISSPCEPGAAYVGAYSTGTSPGIPVPGAGTIPLNPDALFNLSLLPGNGIFFNTVGTLSTTGVASMPIAVPNVSSLVGLTIYSAFLTIDPANPPSSIGNISVALPITIN